MEIIKIKTVIGGGDIIPPGVREVLTIEIKDGYATFHFLDSRTTKKFVVKSKRDKTGDFLYSERLKKALGEYPGLKKEEIKDNLIKILEKLSGRKIKLKNAK